MTVSNFLEHTTIVAPQVCFNLKNQISMQLNDKITKRRGGKTYKCIDLSMNSGKTRQTKASKYLNDRKDLLKDHCVLIKYVMGLDSCMIKSANNE